MALPALPTTADTRSITERVNAIIRNLYNLAIPDSGPILTDDTRVLQVVNTQTGAAATGTTTIPSDDTIPQNTEGDQYMSLAITPKSASSKLKVDVVFNCSYSTTSRVISALFRDSGADAIAAAEAIVSTGSFSAQVIFAHWMDSPGTSATTFKVRAGGAVAGTLTFNGRSGARIFGGIMASSITITEVL